MSVATKTGGSASELKNGAAPPSLKCLILRKRLPLVLIKLIDSFDPLDKSGKACRLAQQLAPKLFGNELLNSLVHYRALLVPMFEFFLDRPPQNFPMRISKRSKTYEGMNKQTILQIVIPLVGCIPEIAHVKVRRGFVSGPRMPSQRLLLLGLWTMLQTDPTFGDNLPIWIVSSCSRTSALVEELWSHMVSGSSHSRVGFKRHTESDCWRLPIGLQYRCIYILMDSLNVPDIHQPQTWHLFGDHLNMRGFQLPDIQNWENWMATRVFAYLGLTPLGLTPQTPDSANALSLNP